MPTLIGLRNIVRRDSALSDTTIISDANLNTLLVEGALDLARRGDAFILNATWSGVVSASTYILSGASPKVTGFLDWYWPAGALIYNPIATSTLSPPQSFQITSEAYLDLNVPGWQDVAASDTLLKVYLSYNTTGDLLLGVYPPTLTTTPTFKLYYLSRGTDMSADGNYPWTNSTTNLTHTEPYQHAIAMYAMWKLYETKVYNEITAARYQALYFGLAQEMRMSQARVFAAEVEGERREGQSMATDTFGRH